MLWGLLLSKYARIALCFVSRKLRVKQSFQRSNTVFISTKREAHCSVEDVYDVYRQCCLTLGVLNRQIVALGPPVATKPIVQPDPMYVNVTEAAILCRLIWE